MGLDDFDFKRLSAVLDRPFPSFDGMVAKLAEEAARRDIRSSILFYRGTPAELREEVTPRMEELQADIDAEFPAGIGGLDFRYWQGWTIAARREVLETIDPGISPKVIADFIRGAECSWADLRMFRITRMDFLQLGGGQFLVEPMKENHEMNAQAHPNVPYCGVLDEEAGVTGELWKLIASSQGHQNSRMPSTATNLLREEFEHYLSIKDALVAEHEGKHVLIQGKDVSVHATAQDAYDVGFEKFGADRAFLVREILAEEPIIRFSRPL